MMPLLHADNYGSSNNSTFLLLSATVTAAFYLEGDTVGLFIYDCLFQNLVLSAEL